MNLRVESDQFSLLPQSEQERILARGQAIKDRCDGYVVQILIGPPASSGADPSKVNHASGIVVLVGARYFLFTAGHVVDTFYERRVAESDTVFQVGNLVITTVEDREAWRSDSHDLVAVALDDLDLSPIPSKTWILEAWPAPIAQGDWLVFAGFPTALRIDGDSGEVDLAVLGGLLEVVAGDERTAKVHLPRETLVALKGEIPDPGSPMGGMSGGPAFRLINDRPELAGFVTDFGESLEVFLIAPLSAASEALGGHAS